MLQLKQTLALVTTLVLRPAFAIVIVIATANACISNSSCSIKDCYRIYEGFSLHTALVLMPAIATAAVAIANATAAVAIATVAVTSANVALAVASVCVSNSKCNSNCTSAKACISNC